jgi:hypothetical protein
VCVEGRTGQNQIWVQLDILLLQILSNSPRDKSQGEFLLWLAWMALLILKIPVNFILENKLLTRVGFYWPCLLPRQGYCV